MVAWYVHTSAGAKGPYSEQDIRHGLNAGTINDSMLVCQAPGDWRSVNYVRRIFWALDQQGYYVQVGGGTHGPFTQDRLFELMREGVISPFTPGRKGLGGDWRPVYELTQVEAGNIRSSKGHARAAELFYKATRPLRWAVRIVAQNKLVTACYAALLIGLICFAYGISDIQQSLTEELPQAGRQQRQPVQYVQRAGEG